MAVPLFPSEQALKGTQLVTAVFPFLLFALGSLISMPYDLATFERRVPLRQCRVATLSGEESHVCEGLREQPLYVKRRGEGALERWRPP
eukprot:5578281-Pleurochrysis_carterae.AAC.2